MGKDVLNSQNDSINYDELLNDLHDRMMIKADKAETMANECEIGSAAYYRYKFYAKGIYETFSELSLLERKAKRKLNSQNKENL